MRVGGAIDSDARMARDAIEAVKEGGARDDDAHPISHADVPGRGADRGRRRPCRHPAVMIAVLMALSTASPAHPTQALSSIFCSGRNIVPSLSTGAAITKGGRYVSTPVMPSAMSFARKWTSRSRRPGHGVAVSTSDRRAGWRGSRSARRRSTGGRRFSTLHASPSRTEKGKSPAFCGRSVPGNNRPDIGIPSRLRHTRRACLETTVDGRLMISFRASERCIWLRWMD